MSRSRRRGTTLDCIAAIEEDGDQQLTGVGLAQHDARVLNRRDHVEEVVQLLVGERGGFPWSGVRVFGALGGAARGSHICDYWERRRARACSQAMRNGGRSIFTMSQSLSSRMASYS